MNYNNPYSAREHGRTVVRGSAEPFELPQEDILDFARVESALTDDIFDVAPKEFKLDRHFLPGISDLSTKAQFVNITDHGATREESYHEMMFGQLLLNAEDEGEHSLHVAVKPFDNVPDAVHEYAVSSYIADDNLDNCQTFRPVGVVGLPKGKVGTISLYRHSVRSMDGIFWNPNMVDQTDIVNKALGRAGVSLALLHNNRWIHGDAQAKNNAWDVLRPFDSAFIIDVESAQPIGHMDAGDQRELRMRDIRSFVGSLYQLAEVDDSLIPEGYDDQIKEHFGLAYAGAQQIDDVPKSTIDFDSISGIVDRESPRKR